MFRADGAIDDPAMQARLQTIDEAVATLPHVASVRGPFDQGAQGQVSPQGQIAYATVVFDKATEDLPKAAVQEVVDTARAAAGDGLQVELGGEAISKVAQAAPGSSEGIGILAAIIILLIAFGSVIAMGLPILTALFGIGIGVSIVSILSHWMIVPTFGTELAAMIGIGVGIDYALFIVTRYRQGLAEGRDPRDAVVKALDTSGRAVLFAGTTVVISLFGMFLLGVSFVYGLALGAISAVLLVMAASMTLLPAMLGFAGLAIDRLRIPGFHVSAAELDEHGFWYRWSRVDPAAAVDHGDHRLRHPGGDGAARALDAPALHRLGQRPDLAHHPPVLRPALRGLRRRHQRPARHRRRTCRPARRPPRSTGCRRPSRPRPTWRSSCRRGSTTPATPPSWS